LALFVFGKDAKHLENWLYTFPFCVLHSLDIKTDSVGEFKK